MEGLYGVQGLAPSRETGDAESLYHQIVNISIYCVVCASLSAVVGTFYPSRFGYKCVKDFSQHIESMKDIVRDIYLFGEIFVFPYR